MISTIAMYVGAVALLLIFVMQSKLPKKDGRFRTGYKNNARPPIKSEEVRKAQRVLWVICGLCAIVYLIGRLI